MNIRVRTVAELEKKRDETTTRLFSLEALIGHQLFASGSSFTGEQGAAVYAQLNRAKDSLLAIITDIQQISSGRSEIKNRVTEIKKQTAGLSANWEELLEKLGADVFAGAPQLAADPQLFTGIQGAKKTIEELERQIFAIKTEMETQNLFNRLVTQVKLVTVNNTAALHKRKLSQLFIKLAKETLESAAVKESHTAGSLDAQITFSYEKCLALQQEISAQEKRCRSLQEEDSRAKEKLITLGACDNPEKRIAELRSDFHKKESEVEALCQKTGHSFANMYVTPDGEELMPYSGPVQGFLPDIASERTQLRSYNRRIEILQLLGAIEETDKKMTSLNQEVGENNHKIEKLQESNSELTKKISVVTNLKQNLHGRLEELESIEKPTTRLLDKPEKKTSMRKTKK